MSDVVRRIRQAIAEAKARELFRGHNDDWPLPIIVTTSLLADICDTIDKLRSERRRLRKRVAVLRGMLPAEEDWRQASDGSQIGDPG